VTAEAHQRGASRSSYVSTMRQPQIAGVRQMADIRAFAPGISGVLLLP
jgi:hypothetical protein